MSAALLGLAVALPLGVVGAVGMPGGAPDTAMAVRTCEAFTAREYRVQRIGHSLTDAARRFCGQHVMPAALTSPRTTADLPDASVITQPWPTLAARVITSVRPALTDLPPPVDC